MDNLFHIITSWTSPFIILLLGGLLLAFGLPGTASWKHLRCGCVCLAISYFALGLAGLVEAVSEYVGNVVPNKPQVVLAVSFFQAMLFTGTSLIFIRPQVLSRRVIFRQLQLIVPLVFLLLLSYVCWPAVHPYIFLLVAGAYLGQLIYYTHIFRREYRRSVSRQQLQNLNPLSKRLRWVNRLFYFSLGIGVMALVYVLVPFRHAFAHFFVVCYTSFYTLVVFRFIAYSRHADFEQYDAAFADAEEPAAEPVPPAKKSQEERLDEALTQWVRDERYLCQEATIEEVALELNTDVYTLHDYLLARKGVLFRTWRIMLRIEKAKQLLELNPSMKIADLQCKAGFADKSFFYRQFKQATGKTPNEYRNDLF